MPLGHIPFREVVPASGPLEGSDRRTGWRRGAASLGAPGRRRLRPAEEKKQGVRREGEEGKRKERGEGEEGGGGAGVGGEWPVGRPSTVAAAAACLRVGRGGESRGGGWWS